MATKKKTLPTSRPYQPLVEITPYQKISKKERQGTAPYLLIEAFNMPGRISILPDNTKLLECEDGYYSVYVKGVKMWFRIGPSIFAQMKVRILSES